MYWETKTGVENGFILIYLFIYLFISRTYCTGFGGCIIIGGLD